MENIIQMFQTTNQRERDIYIPLYYGEKDPLGSLELHFQVVGSLHEMGMLVLGEPSSCSYFIAITSANQANFSGSSQQDSMGARFNGLNWGFIYSCTWTGRGVSQLGGKQVLTHESVAGYEKCVRLQSP